MRATLSCHVISPKEDEYDESMPILVTSIIRPSLKRGRPYYGIRLSVRLSFMLGLISENGIS